MKYRRGEILSSADMTLMGPMVASLLDLGNLGQGVYGGWML